MFGGPRVAYPNGDEAEYVTTLYLCRIVAGEPEVRDDESTDLHLFAANALPAIPILELLPEPLERLLTRAETAFVWNDSWIDDAA